MVQRVPIARRNVLADHRGRSVDEQGRSVVIVSHDDRLKQIADRILWLEDGAFKAMSAMATDPICGMAVEREGAPHLVAGGELLYFCGTGCRDEFAAGARVGSSV